MGRLTKRVTKGEYVGEISYRAINFDIHATDSLMSSGKKTLRDQRPLFDLQKSIQLEFLGWDQPILHAAVEYLFTHYRRGTNWDLDRMLVVLPGSLAGRRLQVLLAEKGSRERVVLRPPRFLTLGKLPEELYQAKLPFASELTQIMAWVRVLRATPASELQPLLFEVPANDHLATWMDLARLLSGLHRELASDLVDFNDVSNALAGTAEEARWQVLSKLQRRYLDVLHEAGLWDVQSARRYAIAHGEVTGIDHEVVLIGTVDLNQAQRRFLAAIAPNVKALVGAPASYAEGFDRDGTLRSEYWQNLEIPIAEEQIHVRTTISDAADELAIQLAQLGSTRSPADITVGVPDVSLVPSLQESLSRSGVPLRYGPGIPVRNTPPMKVLQSIEEYLIDETMEAFSNLIRTSAVYEWLLEHGRIAIETVSPKNSSNTTATPVPTENQEPQTEPMPPRFLAAIDGYLAATLLRSVNVPEWPQAKGRAEFVAAVEAIDAWLKPLREGKRRLSQWAEPWRQIFIELFGRGTVDRDQPDGNLVYRGCKAINEVLDRLAAVPSALDTEIDLTECLGWIHQQLHSVQIPPLVEDGAIEMIGWLELSLDDRPVLMLTGMHDGVLPESVNSDAFLPNRLRSELGLIDNARRYARDAYVMLTLLHTREHLEFIMNRLSSDGDSLTPSRLMMTVPTEKLAQRVTMLISDPEPSNVVIEGWKSRHGQSNVPIPKPDPKRRIHDMAVTDFKKYSECPYRFYLRKIERASTIDHLPLELDGGGFGDLVHKVLEGLITSEVARSVDPKAISTWLNEELARVARRMFGSLQPPALVIQIEQAKLRFEEFAIHQANHARDGWEIKYIEHTVERGKGIKWELPAGIMEIHGRIDRIDYKEKTGEYAVWDYKTGGTTDEPRKNHLASDGTWQDWQLPLYGKLISTLQIEDLSKVQFGYILLPKNAKHTQFVRADFTLEEHAAAIKSAEEIANRVLEGEFWPPSSKIPLDWDDYKGVVQRTVVRPWSWEIEEKLQSEAEQNGCELKSSEPNESKRETSDETQPAESEHSPEGGLSGTPAIESFQDAKLDAAHRETERPHLLKKAPVPKRISVEPVLAEGVPPEEWFSPSMILASAGTGKTYQLASRAIRLLFTDQSLDSILATTFTRKAAGEILHRVLSWLADGCETNEGFHRLCDILQPMKITRDTARYQLSRLCSHLHRFRVSTLDSFYSQLAKSFALELKLPPGWTLIDPVQEEQVNREAITRMFDSIEYRHLRSLISQLSKGEAVRGVRAEIESVVADAYELYRQAPKEAWTRMIVPSAPSEEQVNGALQVLENTSMANNQQTKGKDKLRVQFLESDWEDFLTSTLALACIEDEPTYYNKPISAPMRDAVRVLSGYALTSALTYRRLQNEAAYQVLVEFDRCLREIKQTRRMVTFSDVAERLSQWMRATVETNRAKEDERSDEEPSENNPSMQSIAHRMDCSVDHLLLDEFQDTSPVQWGIVKPFAEAIVENVNPVDGATSFFCVGDTKQAIYSWRGGVSEIFESVGQQIKNVKDQKLTESRRSSSAVIDFVNETFRRLPEHENFIGEDGKKKDEGRRHALVQQWLDRYFAVHKTAKADLAGYVEFRNANVQENKDNEGLRSSPDLFKEVAERIAELHREAPHVTIGVLTRANRDIATIISRLRELGVEASQEGGNPLTDTAPILLVMSALQLADHPGDTLAHFHLKHSPMIRLWDESLQGDPNRLSANLREKLAAFGFGGLVSWLVNGIAEECTVRDQQRMQQLIEEAYRFDTFGQSQIHEFLDFIERHRMALPGESKVRVMTIHQSKGLEFDAVFLPTLDQAITRTTSDYIVMRPDRMSAPIGIMRAMNHQLLKYMGEAWQVAHAEMQRQKLGEALCLFYVALTRARQALYMYTSPSKSQKKRWGSVLHSIYASDPATWEQSGIVILERGNPQWYSANVDEIASKQNATAEVVTPRRVRVALAHGKLGTEKADWVAPSQLNERSSSDIAALWKPEEVAGTVVGKLVHRWFEEVRGWIEDFRPTKKMLTNIAAATLTQEEMTQLRLAQWIDKFMAYCESPEIRNALSRDRYSSWSQPQLLRLEVSTERRLLQLLDGALIRGVIDRCVLGIDGDRVVRAEILDFKTDQRGEGEELRAWIEGRKEEHAPQLNAYRRVLCRQFSLHPDLVQSTLILLSENKVESIGAEY